MIVRYFDCHMTMRHGACPLVNECVGGCGYKQARKIIESMRVGEFGADYTMPTPEELAQPTGAEELLARSKSVIKGV